MVGVQRQVNTVIFERKYMPCHTLLIILPNTSLTLLAFLENFISPVETDSSRNGYKIVEWSHDLAEKFIRVWIQEIYITRGYDAQEFAAHLTIFSDGNAAEAVLSLYCKHISYLEKEKNSICLCLRFVID